MARFFEPTPEQEQVWRDWLAGQSSRVREVAERFEPFSLYRIRTTGQRVTVQSYDEHPDGTVTMTVLVSGRFNLVPFATEVFGFEPEDLEPCGPPDPDEPVGTMLTNPATIEEYIDAIRPHIIREQQ